MSSFLPVANYTKPFWLSEEDFIGTYRSSETLPTETDVLIVGSGYAGTSTAWFLSKEDPDLKITVLEARNICSGATGRNGGHVKPFYYSQHNDVADEYGLEEAAKNVEFEYRHLAEIKRLTEQEGIDCDFTLTRLCDVFYDDEKYESVKLEVDAFFANPHIDQAIKDQYQIYHGLKAKTISFNDKTNHALTAPAASIWPWKLITGLLKKLIKLPNFNLQANTPVTAFKHLDDGTISVTTPRGEIITKKIVIATNGYTKAILPEFSEIITPFKGAVTHIVPKATPVPLLNFSSVIFTDKDNADYLINRPDGSIVVGGAIETYLGAKPDYTKEVFSTDDSYVLEETKKYLENYPAKHYSTWANFETENDYYWSGILGFSNDEFPYVGSLAELGRSNSYIIAGFSGHGMPRVLLSGKALAKSIVSGEPLDDIPACYKFSMRRVEKKEHMTKLDMAERYKNLFTPST